MQKYLENLEKAHMRKNKKFKLDKKLPKCDKYFS